MNLFNNNGFICVDRIDGIKPSKEKFICYFVYFRGKLSYIGYGSHQRLLAHTKGWSGIREFKEYPEEVEVFAIKEFYSKDEARLFESHYIKKLKPIFNKQYCGINKYINAKQSRFLPDKYMVSSLDSDFFKICLLHQMRVDNWVICKMFNITDIDLTMMVNRTGNYKMLINPFEYFNSDGKMCVDKDVCKHFKIKYRPLFDQSDKIYMKIGRF
jgi:hypothetical protein